MRAWLFYLLVVLVLGIAGWVVWRQLQRPEYVNFPPSATGPWVAFGDSLTEGYGAGEGKDYPSELDKQLGVKIVNLGKSGETSADGLKRVGKVAELRPAVVLLCFGGNDGLEQLSRGEMFRNVGMIIDRLHEQGAFVVLIGVRSTSLRDQNEKGFRQLAKEKKVFYIADMLKGVFPKPVYMSDAVHPNEEGYRLIAQRLGREIRPLMEGLRSGR